MFPMMPPGAGMFPNPMMFPGMDPSMFAEMQGMVMPGMQGMPMMMPGVGQGVDMSGGQGGAGGKGAADSGIYFKTRICNRWKEGNCPYQADDCRYAHGDADLRRPQQNAPSGAAAGGARAGNAMQSHGKVMTAQPNMGMGMAMMGGGAGGGGGGARHGGPGPNASAAERQAWHKTRVCERFMETGECSYGDRCTFAHGEHELRAPPTTGGRGAGQGVAAAHNLNVQKAGSGMMPVMRPGGAPPAAAGPANGSLKRPLEAPSAMPAGGGGGFVGDGAGGFAGDAKRQRGAAPIVPPAQERLPDASSPPLSLLKEKFEHLKQECARFASETGHSVAMFTVGGILSDLQDSGTDDFSEDLYVKSVTAPGAAPNLKLAVLKHGTGGICRQLTVRPEIVKFVCARGTKALAELVSQDRLTFDGE